MAWTTLAAQPAQIQKVITQIASRNPALSGATVGVSVRDASGKEIVALHSGQRMIPASNMKLITTGAALHSLGPDYTFKTAIGYTGEIVDGTLKGDIYIIGGGDPTLGAPEKDYGNLPFAQWLSILRKAGINTVDGRIIGDSRLWEGYHKRLALGLEPFAVVIGLVFLRSPNGDGDIDRFAAVSAAFAAAAAGFVSAAACQQAEAENKRCDETN